MLPKKLVHGLILVFLLSNSLSPSLVFCQASKPQPSDLPSPTDHAEILLIDLIGKNPQIPKLYLMLASLYIQRREYQKIISLVEFAEANNAESNDLYQREAEALFLMGHYGLCMATLAKMK